MLQENRTNVKLELLCSTTIFKSRIKRNSKLTGKDLSTTQKNWIIPINSN